MVMMQPSKGQGRQQLGDGRLLVRFGGRRALSQDQTGPSGKRADQVQRGGPRFPRPTARLAIDRDDFIFRQSRYPLTDPTQEGRSEFVSINRREHSAKRIVAGNALLQSQILPQPVQFLFAPRLDFDKGIGARQDRADGHHQQVHQIVLDLLRLPWVAHPNPHVYQPKPLFCLHGNPQKDRKLHKSEGCEQPLRNLLRVNNYFRGSTTMAFMRLPCAAA